MRSKTHPARKAQPPDAETPSLDESLAELAAEAATLLRAEHCSIMLGREEDSGDVAMRVCASYGALPEEAFRQITASGEGIAGQVAATGKALLVENIEESEYAKRARHQEESKKSFVCAPITVDGEIIGVLNVRAPKRRRAFNGHDLTVLQTVALYVGKSIQTIQLRSLLRSRFAQLHLSQGTDRVIGDAIIQGAQHPDQLARMLAKSFYREMTRAGFSSNQIINAASEIISQLSGSLQKHSRRMGRK